MKGARYLTYATEQNYHLHRLLTSAAYHGIHLEVLGLGDPWTAFVQKLVALRRALDSSPVDQIVLFVDAYDTIFLQPPAVIEARFRAFQRPVVFSAEIGFHAPGHESLAAHYPPSETAYRYLNSGCFVGYAGPLARILDHVLGDSSTDDDQSLLSRYFVDRPGAITLDYHTSLFFNTSGRPYDEDLQARGDILLNTQTGTDPCILHTPGRYYGVLEHYSLKLPFYRDVRWSRLNLEVATAILRGILNLHGYRLLQRLKAVRP